MPRAGLHAEAANAGTNAGPGATPRAVPRGEDARPGEGAKPAQGKQQRLQALLQELAGQQGIIGAVLVSRDGLRVIDAWQREVWNKETFSAMSATLMGAAEIALGDLGGAKARRVLAETEKTKMLVVGTTDELVLVALSEADLPLDRFMTLVGAAADAITKVVSGA